MTPAESHKQTQGSPPCLRFQGVVCRGCPGWRALVAATAPGGPWQGVEVRCACTGQAARESR